MKKPPQTIPELYEAMEARFDAMEAELSRVRRGVENLEIQLLPEKERVFPSRVQPASSRLPRAAKRSE